MHITAEISNRIEEEVGLLQQEPIGHINYEGIRYKALPLYGTIGEVWLLRADGSLWKVDSDLGVPLQPLPQQLHTMAIVAGIEQYPWLRELLPHRPVDAANCPDCGGTGRLGPHAGAFCQSCGALGWVVRD